jgi:hypothetical protein
MAVKYRGKKFYNSSNIGVIYSRILTLTNAVTAVNYNGISIKLAPDVSDTKLFYPQSLPLGRNKLKCLWVEKLFRFVQ